VMYSPGGDYGFRVNNQLHPTVTTDAAGKFTVPNLIPGASYQLRWPNPAAKRATGYLPVSVVSGEAKDLGDVSGKTNDE
jgi:hypothetical protein